MMMWVQYINCLFLNRPGYDIGNDIAKYGVLDV